MIVKMKKVSLVVQTKDKEKALKSLADSEVFHISATETKNNHESFNALLSKRGQLEEALMGLPAKVKLKSNPTGTLDTLVAEISKTKLALKEKDELAIELGNECDRIALWGNFLPETINFIVASALPLGFYEVEKQQLKSLRKGNHCFTLLKAVKNRALILVVATNKGELPSFNQFVIPKNGLQEMRTEIVKLRHEMAELNSYLAQLAQDVSLIHNRLAVLDEQIEYQKAYLAMQDDEDLAIISGYIPAQSYKNFKERAQKEHWALLAKDITEQDDSSQVPTKTEQKGVGALAQPILSMFGLTPGYHEYDITGVMFFAFSLFFGIIIGDAGYGIVLFFIGLLLLFKGLKQREKPSNGLIMWLWLSFFTILWGAINGAWFGFEVLRAKSPFKLFIVQWFTSNDNIMFFSFVVGLIHLSIGHLWVFVRKIRAKSLSAIAQLGSLAMLTGFFFLVMLLILGWKSIPTWTTPAIIGGLFVIIMFGQQKRGQSFFKGIAAGFTNAFPTVLGSIGNFSDIISYIRLYAVSLAGASIAIAFNDIAMSIPSPVNIIATPLVVIGAHTMNISLGILSVVVHALRLNSLEFSSHLGLEWSGFQYKPFTAKNNIGRGEL